MSVQLSQAKQTARKIGRRILWVIFGVFFLFCIGYFAYSQLSYSDGYRSGQLVKISRRGVVFKTHEGTLNLSPNGMMTAWEFSVKDAKTSTQLQGFEGKHVRVHYEQRYQTFFWQGETEYIVDQVELVQ
ncbi:MAG: 6-phosphogluconate dehydrogenase [Phycisphaerae bacterium]|nr:6-phosphogluconate dehydrogenase [Saprospiraceae bacterium]